MPLHAPMYLSELLLVVIQLGEKFRLLLLAEFVSLDRLDYTQSPWLISIAVAIAPLSSSAAAVLRCELPASSPRASWRPCPHGPCIDSNLRADSTSDSHVEIALLREPHLCIRGAGGLAAGRKDPSTVLAGSAGSRRAHSWPRKLTHRSRSWLALNFPFGYSEHSKSGSERLVGWPLRQVQVAPPSRHLGPSPRPHSTAAALACQSKRLKPRVVLEPRFKPW